MDETDRKWFSYWVRITFRDVADHDYLAARLLYKNGLFQASVWSALQAVEKYLKGILLFNYRSVKGFKHNLPKLWQTARELTRLDANLPQECVEFIDYLNIQGTNRYLDFPPILYLEGGELHKLDMCVWHIRRYCQDFMLLPEDDNHYRGESQKLLAEIPHNETPETVKTFYVPNGFLESLLDDKRKPLRDVLIWKNFYYGIYKKHHIKYKDTISIERPASMIRPELIPIIEQVIDIPKKILIELRNYHDQKTLRSNSNPTK